VRGLDARRENRGIAGRAGRQAGGEPGVIELNADDEGRPSLASA